MDGSSASSRYFLGGLALNLTPCVYPLIGVTIAYFGNQGGGHRRVMYLAIVFVLGIALMFSSVGVAVAMSGGLFGAALQNPVVLVVLSMMLLDACRVELRTVRIAAAAVDYAACRLGASRICGRVADGPWDGCSGGAMHRADRARACC